MVEPVVIQKMNLCGLVEGRPYDLTGLYRLMMALDFTAPWRHVLWMRDSLSTLSLPVGAAKSRHHETTLKHIQVLHAFSDRDLQGLIIPHGIIPLHVMFKSFHLGFTKTQLTVVSNVAELHKAHVLHHWRLVSIPMINQEVNPADASTVANCHLCNHPFRNLYEIKETGYEEKLVAYACSRGVFGSESKSNLAVTVFPDATLSLSSFLLILSCFMRRRSSRWSLHTPGWLKMRSVSSRYTAV